MSSIPPAAAQRPAAAFLARRRPDGLTLLIAAIALLGVALALARGATYGVALQSDALAFIRAARDLLAGDGFSAEGGYTTWPPLYPLLLAAASLGIFDPYTVAGPLNAALFGLTIFIVGQWLRHRLQSRFLTLWVCLGMALSIPLATAASYALTETPFILITTLALILADKFLADGKTSSLFWAAAFCALAWQTRHIGVAAAVFVGLLILLQRGASLSQKARLLAGLSIIVALPAALWRLRNYLAAGDLPDNIYHIDNILLTLIKEVFSGLWRWLYSGLPLEPWLPTALAAAVLLPSCCILIIEQYKKRNLPQWRPFVIFGGFALVYIALLIGALMLQATLSSASERFLTPLYVPLIIVVAMALDLLIICLRNIKVPINSENIPVIKKIARNRVKILGLMSTILMIVLSFWTIGQIEINIQDIIRSNSINGANIYARLIAGSETLRYFKENPIPGIVYSNEKGLLRFHKYQAVHYRHTPFRGGGGDLTQQEQLASFRAAAPEGAYIVWLNTSLKAKNYDYTGADLRISPGFEPVAELSDGFIFKVNRGYTPESNPYRAEYEAIVSGGEPAIRSTFDVYIRENSLSYIKDTCAKSDVQEPFLLHLTPADAADLPADSRKQGFDNLDFLFRDYGVRVSGRCMMTIPLPDYPIALIRTGQFAFRGESIWQAEINPGALGRFKEIAAGLDGLPAAAAGGFELYWDGGRLVYRKEPCIAADTEARFFLHLFPADVNDLPPERQRYGFGNLGFDFPQYGAIRGDKCLAAVPLPGYEIVRIRTGQYRPGGAQIWQADFPAGR